MTTVRQLLAIPDLRVTRISPLLVHGRRRVCQAAYIFLGGK